MNKWLIQTILWDEIISKLNFEDLDYIDELAWKYTQITKEFIPHKDVMESFKLIENELLSLRGKYSK